MDKRLIETLAKVIIAAGWADKSLTLEEINSLKDLMFKFQETLIASDQTNLADEEWAAMGGFNLDSDRGSGLPSRQQAMLEMYTESPIDAAERERLMNGLREAVSSDEDKQLVLSALKSMVEADGKITDDEKAVLSDVNAALESVDTGFFSELGRLLGGALQRRAEAVRSSPNREEYFEDFLKNKVYYEVRRRLDLGEADVELPEEDLRKLSTVGGLMARVAQTDCVVIEKETDKITSILETSWGLSRQAATFVIEVALSAVGKNFDYLRMSREFVDMTTPAERANLLHVLFAVANADGEVSKDELREIHHIADYLLLSDNRVREAHSKIAH